MPRVYDASPSYSLDVNMEKEKKFISHCGPGEWVVCNCITEDDDYVPYIPTPDELESVEAEELLDPSDSASKPEE